MTDQDQDRMAQLEALLKLARAALPADYFALALSIDTALYDQEPRRYGVGLGEPPTRDEPVLGSLPERDLVWERLPDGSHAWLRA